MARKRQAQQCVKVKRSGERCGGYAVTGGSLCRAHLRPSPAAAAIVKEKMMEANAQSIAQRAVWEPSSMDHQRLRTRSIMLSVARLRTLVEVYYEAAKGGDAHAGVMLVNYQRELTSLLKIVPIGTGGVDPSSVDDAMEKISRIVEGAVSAAEVVPLRRTLPESSV